MENGRKETHSHKNSLSISGEGLLASTFGLPRHSLEDVQAKRIMILKTFAVLEAVHSCVNLNVIVKVFF